MLKADNPVVGGNVLRRAAIQSPNFVTGSTGWTIRQDGSAEFNNLVVRNGQIISGVALYYSSAPGAGTLVEAISAVDGTDSFGTAYYAGTTTFAPSAGHSFPVTLLSVTKAAFFQYRSPSGGVQGSLIGSLAFSGSTDPVTGFTYPAGFLAYDPVFTDFLNVTGGNVYLGIAASAISRNAHITVQQAGSPSGNPYILIEAPEQGTANHMSMLMQGASPDATQEPQALLGQSAGGALAPIGNSMLEVQAGLNQTAQECYVNAATPSSVNYLAGQVVGDTFKRWKVDGTGKVHIGNGSSNQDTTLGRGGVALLTTDADFDITVAGKGLRIAEGANAKQGRGTLTAGQLVVATTAVTANSIIYPGWVTPSANAAALFVSAVTVGTGFT